jgi:hypothetical protein
MQGLAELAPGSLTPSRAGMMRAPAVSRLRRSSPVATSGGYGVVHASCLQLLTLYPPSRPGSESAAGSAVRCCFFWRSSTAFFPES